MPDDDHTQLWIGRAVVAIFVLVATPALIAFAASDPIENLLPAQASDFYDAASPPDAKIALGRALFFDKVLSGNRNISCATCHHPDRASSDGLSLPLGEGAVGLGPKRRAGTTVPVFGRVPRNSQALFNLGATEFVFMFHDGRITEDPHNNWGNRFWTPAREQLPPGLDSVLAAQAMFPVLSRVEMVGHKSENEIANAVASDRLGEAWNLLTDRLRAIPAYVDMFRAAYPEVKDADDLNFVRAANAIAAFEATAFRATGSPFDQFLESRDPSVMGEPAIRGMELFYGEAGCGSCHSGRFQTDHDFHAIAMPQIGPGKGDGIDQSYWNATGFKRRLEDRGRYRVTFRLEDMYKFRTPSLRNVELTGPWGHAGAYATLENVTRHHLDPINGMESYSISQAVLPKVDLVIEETGEGAGLHYDPVNPARVADYRKRDGWVQTNPQLRQAIANANELAPRNLTGPEIADLIEFLKALTDPKSRDMSHLVPASVPSGLPVGD
jgi:cytochrome c peroxidase